MALCCPGYPLAGAVIELDASVAANGAMAISVGPLRLSIASAAVDLASDTNAANPASLRAVKGDDGGWAVSLSGQAWLSGGFQVVAQARIVDSST